MPLVGKGALVVGGGGGTCWRKLLVGTSGAEWSALLPVEVVGGLVLRAPVLP